MNTWRPFKWFECGDGFTFEDPDPPPEYRGPWHWDLRFNACNHGECPPEVEALNGWLAPRTPPMPDGPMPNLPLDARWLFDFQTGKCLRRATPEEIEESKTARWRMLKLNGRLHFVGT